MGLRRENSLDCGEIELSYSLSESYLLTSPTDSIETTPLRRQRSSSRSEGDIDGEEGSGESVLPLGEYHLVTEQHVSMLYDEKKGWDKGEDSACVRAGACCERVLCRKETWLELFPLVSWLPKYSLRKDFLTDLSAGITLGVILIPQGLSYGLLAGLPAVYGLYACIAAPCVYAAFGTCRQIHIGPFALISLLVVGTVGNVVAPYEAGSGADPTAYVQAVMSTSVMVGIILFLLGMLRLGVIVSYLSDPVISSLTTAGAFLIATSQMKHVLGLDIPRGLFFETWIKILSSLGSVNLVTLGIGVGSFLLLFFIDLINSRFPIFKKQKLPGALIVLIISILVVQLSQVYETHSVKVLGTIPSGLPSPAFPTRLDTDLIVPAMVIAIVGFSLSIATGKTLAEKNNYEITPNQEMIAHGLANLVGGICLGYPAFASLSRSAICHTLGVNSPVHNFIAASVVMVVLAALTSTLSALPFATLAAIIFYSLRSLFKQLRDVKPLWRTNKMDFCVWILTFFCTLGFGIEYGLLTGVGASMFILLYSVTYPPTSVLGQLPDLPWLFKDIDRFAQAKDVPNIVIFRFGSALHFANKDCLQRSLLRAVRERRSRSNEKIHTVILDSSSLNFTDVSGIRLLQKLQEKLSVMEIELMLCNCRGAFRDGLKKAGFTAPRYMSIHDAVRYASGKQPVALTPSDESCEQENEEDKSNAVSLV